MTKKKRKVKPPPDWEQYRCKNEGCKMLLVFLKGQKASLCKCPNVEEKVLPEKVGKELPF